MEATQLSAVLLPNADSKVRRLANFPPSVWGTTFASLTPQESEIKSNNKEVDALKEKVKDMLLQSTTEPTENVKFIDLLRCLGVSYHFESEINEQLNHILKSLSKIIKENDHDLYTLSVLFRVLRENGHKTSCDMFLKFKDSDGHFKDSITTDVKGLLGFYEASFLSLHGEEILDEALLFTRQHLGFLADKSSPNLAQLIRFALTSPIHHNIERINTLQYISFYEKEDSRSEILLKFAKLDFNRVQLLYRKELSLLSRWWDDTKIMENVTYTRDRIVEAYTWAVGSVFEPKYVDARIRICQHVMLETILDDTYDAFGTIEELRCFTAALKRFTIDVPDELPDCMKFFYKFLVNFFEESKSDGKRGCPCKAFFSIEMLKELANAYLTESEWLNAGYSPTFDEYMKQIGNVTSTNNFAASAFLLEMEDMGMKEIAWFLNGPKMVKASMLLGRLWNDIASYEWEQERGDTISGVMSYVNQHGVSEEEAKEAIYRMLHDGWKNMNEDLINAPNVPKMFLKYLMNFSRVIKLFYGTGKDAYTRPTFLKNLATSLFMEPLPM